MASTGTLETATQDRKARLAQLRGLKRKQPDPSEEYEAQITPAKDEEASVTTTYLSGRNYDAETRGPKLGFEIAPDAEKDTLEVRAAALELHHRSEVAKAEEEKDAPIDLFKLQPKKPNWDLKRDFKERTAVLDVRTKNAVARLVRERLEGEKARKIASGEKNGPDEDVVPMKGGELVEAVHIKERQEEEERRREREEDEAEIT